MCVVPETSQDCRLWEMASMECITLRDATAELSGPFNRTCPELGVCMDWPFNPAINI